ncbi:uncharacterized protein [Cicer arietinum]|uniref:uncharacterized protein n=1 Tax=Cicer arietinum TaxID=3827 RepID=UPI003CC6A404
MLFFLTTKKLANVLNDEIPVVPETDSQIEKDKKAVELTQWEHNDYLCKNYILNGLPDDLYVYYCSDNNTSKQVWDALKKKYDTEEAEVKKYVVSHYLKYQMTNDRSMEAQSHEIQKIAHEIISEGMSLDEQVQIAVVIDKLPPAWKDGCQIDIGASRHICYKRAMFKTYTTAEDKKMLLGDSHTTNIVDIGDAKLIFTFRKTLILNDVMHTLEIRKNLVSEFLLNKAEFTQTIGAIGAYLYTISKNGIFVGK